MKDLMDRIFSSPMLVLIILGIICLLISASGGLQFGNFSLELATNGGKLTLGFAGAILILVGLAALWINLGKDQSFGYNYGWGIKPREIKCKGSMKDLFLLCNNKIDKMPLDRGWRYELSDVLIKQHPRNIRIDFTLKIKYPTKAAGIDIFRCSGFGPFDGTVAYVKYGLYSDAKKFSDARWSGVMVLRIPKAGNIKGVWLTTSTNKDCVFPIGSITLKNIVSLQ